VEEVAVGRPGQRPSAGGDRGHHQQPHAGQPAGQLPGGQAAVVGDDAAQVRAGARRAAVKQLAQVVEFFRGLEHPPITPPGYDISSPRCGAAEAG
jgi:hypothetical protein